MHLTEFTIIYEYLSRLVCQRDDVNVGIGDDAAIVTVPENYELVITMDTIVEGVHFFPDTCPSHIAYKALAVNLSDLAAMGATPAYFTLSLTLPHSDQRWIEKFCEGLAPIIIDQQIQLIGGDITQGPLSITIQAHGYIEKNKAIRRNGAKPGDIIFVTGALGISALAVQLLENKLTLNTTDHYERVMNRFYRPPYRVGVGHALRGIASAMIDISDGLAADLNNILIQSRIGASIYTKRLPISPDVTLAMSQEDAILLALSGGEDYELCFTLPPHRVGHLQHLTFDTPITMIGEISNEHGLRCINSVGHDLSLRRLGYEHFEG